MKRPLILRYLPHRLKLSAWSRFYRGRHAGWSRLYESATLTYAPETTMANLLPGDIISDCIAFTGLYELSLTRRLVQQARVGGTMIDVGANLGYFSLLWVAANPKNKAIAIEASPRNLDILRGNIRRNGLESRVQVIPFAAGKESGKVSFNPGPLEQSGWGGISGIATSESFEVEVVRIDDIVENQHIAFLKIDVEGADTWALQGCDALLKSGNIDQVWFEQNKPRMLELGLSEEEANEYLESVGYTTAPQTDTSRSTVDWLALPKGRQE